MLLVSAEPGHILKLDFRNTFDLEYSNNCTYDYLEVRDGGHGYDRLIGLYCGKIFPDIIGSTSRYLWLRFKSDDTIEGGGFTAVYESILPSNGEQRDFAILVRLLCAKHKGKNKYLSDLTTRVLGYLTAMYQLHML
jgi:hypothetical protein